MLDAGVFSHLMTKVLLQNTIMLDVSWSGNTLLVVICNNNTPVISRLLIVRLLYRWESIFSLFLIIQGHKSCNTVGMQLHDILEQLHFLYDEKRLF